MVNRELGASMALDSDFDFKIDETGDIATVVGNQEIGKDLAYFTTLVLNDAPKILNADTIAEMERLVREVLEYDSRIENIISLDVYEADEDVTVDVYIEIEIDVIGQDEPLQKTMGQQVI